MFCDVYCQLSKGSKENMPCYSKCKLRAAPWAPPSKSIPPPLKIMLWKSGRMLRLLHLQHYLGRKNTSGLGLGTPPEQEAWKSSAIPLQKFIIDLKSQGNNMESHGTASKHGWIFDPIGAKTWEGDPMEIVFWMNETPPPAFASAAGFQTDFFFCSFCWKCQTVESKTACENAWIVRRLHSHKEKKRGSGQNIKMLVHNTL